MASISIFVETSNDSCSLLIERCVPPNCHLDGEHSSSKDRDEADVLRPEIWDRAGQSEIEERYGYVVFLFAYLSMEYILQKTSLRIRYIGLNLWTTAATYRLPR